MSLLVMASRTETVEQVAEKAKELAKVLDDAQRLPADDRRAALVRAQCAASELWLALRELLIDRQGGDHV